MKYYSAIKINDSVKFLGKWMELENTIQREVTQSHTWYTLTDKWILVQKLGIPKIQFTDHMKLKKKEDQRVDASVLLRSRNKLLAGDNMEKGYEAETEGKAI